MSWSLCNAVTRGAGVPARPSVVVVCTQALGAAGAFVRVGGPLEPAPPAGLGGGAGPGDGAGPREREVRAGGSTSDECSTRKASSRTH